MRDFEWAFAHGQCHITLGYVAGNANEGAINLAKTIAKCLPVTRFKWRFVA